MAGGGFTRSKACADGRFAGLDAGQHGCDAVRAGAGRGAESDASDGGDERRHGFGDADCRSYWWHGFWMVCRPLWPGAGADVERAGVFGGNRALRLYADCRGVDAVPRGAWPGHGRRVGFGRGAGGGELACAASWQGAGAGAEFMGGGLCAGGCGGGFGDAAIWLESGWAEAC